MRIFILFAFFLRNQFNLKRLSKYASIKKRRQKNWIAKSLCLNKKRKSQHNTITHSSNEMRDANTNFTFIRRTNGCCFVYIIFRSSFTFVCTFTVCRRSNETQYFFYFENLLSFSFCGVFIQPFSVVCIHFVLCTHDKCTFNCNCIRNKRTGSEKVLNTFDFSVRNKEWFSLVGFTFVASVSRFFFGWSIFALFTRSKLREITTQKQTIFDEAKLGSQKRKHANQNHKWTTSIWSFSVFVWHRKFDSELHFRINVALPK